MMMAKAEKIECIEIKKTINYELRGEGNEQWQWMTVELMRSAYVCSVAFYIYGIWHSKKEKNPRPHWVYLIMIVCDFLVHCHAVDWWNVPRNDVDVSLMMKFDECHLHIMKFGRIKFHMKYMPKMAIAHSMCHILCSLPLAHCVCPNEYLMFI